jgi:HSP20 family protein
MTMTTTHTTEKTSNNENSSRACGSRSCGPRGGPGHRFGGHGGPFSRGQTPVNIEETADAYILSLFAVGGDKSGLRVSVNGDVLTIRYEASQDSGTTRKFTRREQPYGSFEREFALNSKVQIEAIAASYSEGVLTVRLPKTPDAMQPERQVPVQ